jgi:CheY-like chemotaxis protein
MVYGFARQSGGGMSIKSEVGEGTTVEIWLPRAAEVAPQAHESVESDTGAEQADQRSLSILLVDDHASVRTTTAALLVDFGHDVIEAADGREAVDLLERQPEKFDLLVTDYAMPLMSGTELIERARQITAGLPALIITGYADEQSIARRPEDVQVIAKPFAPDQMRAAISAASAREFEPPLAQPASARA